MLHYGRSVVEREQLEAAGWEFLVTQARLLKTTSYTEMKHRADAAHRRSGV